MPLVSVLMPVRDCLEYLPEAVNSILGQTHTDLELIVVDDRSSESVSEYLDGVNDDRLYHRRNREHLGLTKSLNICLDAADGEFIARQDGDDYSDSKRLAKQVAAWEPGIGLIGTWARSIRDGNQVADPYLDQVTRLSDKAIPMVMLRENCIVGPSVMYSREAVEAVGFYDETLWFAQDYNYNLRIVRSFTATVVREVLYTRRVHDKQCRRTQKAHDPHGANIAAVCRDRAEKYPYIERRGECL